MEAIEKIQKYARLGVERFEQDELVQTWIVHHLLLIGEAFRALSQTFRDQHPEIQWSKIIGMRNVLVRNYFERDADLVWGVTLRDIPGLKENILGLLGQPQE